MSNKKFRTDHLFVSSNFLIGLGSVLNIAGDYFEFNYSKSGKNADTKAIESDWGVIGQDITDITEKNSVNDFKLSLKK